MPTTTFDSHLDLAYTTVATAPSPATSGTSLVVNAGDGALFIPTGGRAYYAIAWPANTAFPTTANSEFVRVTARSTDTLTITRAQLGSTARAIAIGWQFAAVGTGEDLIAIENALNAIFTSNLDIVNQIVRVGPVTFSLAPTLTAGGPNSGYFIVDKNNTASDSSIVFRDQGAIRGEVGLPADNDLHLKSVTGVAGSEIFTDGIIIKNTTAKVFIPIAAGVGTIPAAGVDLHIGFTRAGSRVLQKIENDGNGGAAIQFVGPGSNYFFGVDIGQNGGNNFAIQDNSTFTPRLMIDGTGKVALGIDTPLAALDVRAAGDVAISQGISHIVTQSAHGFTIGKVLRMSSTTYVLAQANTAANAAVVGIVATVPDANTFTLLFAGRITGLTSLTAGTVYYLNPTTAGAFQTTAPVTSGQISKPLFIADSTTTGYWVNQSGIAVP